MLQRFRTLFNLPSAIRGSISKGEYDLAVREYRKAKSIVLPSHVQDLNFSAILKFAVAFLNCVLSSYIISSAVFVYILFSSKLHILCYIE